MKSKILTMVFILFLYSSCKKKENDQATPLNTNCKINKIEIDGELRGTYTYHGDTLIHWAYDSANFTYDYKYTNGKLTSIFEGSPMNKDTFFFEYGSNGLVSRRNNLYRGRLLKSISMHWNSDGTIHNIFGYEMDTFGATGYNLGYYFSYVNGDLNKMQIIRDADGDGILDSLVDNSHTFEFVVSDKKNPLYGYYLFEGGHYSSLEGVYFTKHTILSFAYRSNIYKPKKVKYSHIYNSDGNLANTITSFEDGSTSETKYSYKCD